MQSEIYSLRAQEPLWIAAGRTGAGVTVKLLTSLRCLAFCLAARQSDQPTGRSQAGAQ